MTIYRYAADGGYYVTLPRGDVTVPRIQLLDVDTVDVVETDAFMAESGYQRISDGDPAPISQTVDDGSISSTTLNTFVDKLILTSGPLAEGVYSFFWLAEIRINPSTGTEGVQADITLNGNSQYETSWGESQWHLFGGAGTAQFARGATPEFRLRFRRIGPNASNVDVRRARMSFTLESI